jgi:2,3-bisphosphoglycerate-independent phosphoglycerate mutase
MNFVANPNRYNKQKIAVIVPDGMSDLKLFELGNKTPMEAANKPCMDFLAQNGICGRVKNVPDGMTPDSDPANLAILGYDPKIYSKGRSPLEAAGIGLEMRANDTAFRCNLVTLSEENIYEEKIMIDYCADEISTEEADLLIKSLDGFLGNDKVRFRTGVSYRHCLLWEDCGKEKEQEFDFIGPHNILDKNIKEYLPSGEYLDLMKKSYDILKDHPVNVNRRKNGKHPANSIWLWSAGVKPDLPDFKSKYGLDASVVAAVSLIKGIGICAGMKTVDVEGATGNYYTNYKNKGLAAIREFENGADFVFVHIEAPDECGHRGEIENKVKSIGKIDDMIIKPVYDYLDAKFADFKILILPDHPTPLSTRTHSSDPVQFLMYRKGANIKSGINNFNEESVAEKSDIYIQDGYKLLDFVLAQ